jgi:WD40 repeat protein
MSRDATLLATVTDKTVVKIWSAKPGPEPVMLRGHQSLIGRLVFSPDGKRLATTSMDKTARIWDTKTGDLVQKISFPSAPSGVVFGQDGKWVAISTAGNNQITMIDPSSGAEMAKIQELEKGSQLVCNADGTMLIFAGRRTVYVWQITIQPTTK